MLFFSSRSPPLPTSLSPMFSPYPPPPCCASLRFHPTISPLLPYPNLHCPLGSCVCPRRPSRLLPRPWLWIFPARTKISSIVLTGARHAGQLQAYPYRTGSDLSGPSTWWGRASSSPCSCTGPNSSTQCTVVRRCGICKPWKTGLWWIRSSDGCSCSTT